MFRLRQEHVESFDRAAWQHFIHVAKNELRAHHPVQFGKTSDAELESFIRQHHSHAAEYDLESEFAVLNFLHLVALLGPDFADRPEHDAIVEKLDLDDADENDRAELALDGALRIAATSAKVQDV